MKFIIFFTFDLDLPLTLYLIIFSNIISSPPDKLILEEPGVFWQTNRFQELFWFERLNSKSTLSLSFISSKISCVIYGSDRCFKQTFFTGATLSMTPAKSAWKADQALPTSSQFKTWNQFISLSCSIIFSFVYFFKDRIVLVLCLLKILLLTLRVQYVMKWSLIPIKSMQLELLSVTLVGESISWNQLPWLKVGPI